MKICLTNEGKTYRFYLPLSGLLLKVVLKLALPVEKEKAKGRAATKAKKRILRGRIRKTAKRRFKNGRGGAGFPPGKNEDPFTRREKAEILSSAEEMRKVLKACRRRLGKFTLIEARDSDGDGISVRI